MTDKHTQRYIYSTTEGADMPNEFGVIDVQSLALPEKPPFVPGTHALTMEEFEKGKPHNTVLIDYVGADGTPGQLRVHMVLPVDDDTDLTNLDPNLFPTAWDAVNGWRKGVRA